MTKQTDSYKDENTIDLTPEVTDTTPGFGVLPNKQKTSVSDFRYLWLRTERPETPKNWDAYYNTKKRKLEIFTTQFYRDQYAPSVSNPYRPSAWDYADVSGELWYTENWAWAPVGVAPPIWERQNSIGIWVEEQGYFMVNNLTTPQTIPTGVWTALWPTSVDFMESVFPDTRGIQQATIPYDGQYLVLWHVTWEQKPGDTKTELRITKTDWFWTTQVSYDVHEVPEIIATTTGTDSLWWSINATTTIAYWPLDFVSQKVVRYWELKEWDIIKAEARQDSGGNLTATAGTTFPTTTQYQTWFTIIWL